MPTREELIVSLTDQLESQMSDAVQRRGGGFILDFDIETSRLRNNGISFDDLTRTELLTAGAALFRVLIPRSNDAFVDRDHQLFWAWVAQLSHADEDNHDEAKITTRELFQLAVRAQLASTRPRAADRHMHDLLVAVDQLIPAHARDLLRHANEVATYLAFPALEAALRLACRVFVTSDGFVSVPFGVKSRRQPYQVGKRCSSTLDLLHLFVDKIADADTHKALNIVDRHLRKVTGESDGFARIYSWRNSTLHGNQMLTTAGSSVLTLAALITVSELRHEFASRQERARRMIQWGRGASIYNNPHGTFYPAW